MFVPRFDAVDRTDPAACAAFLDLVLSMPEVERWKRFSHDKLAVGRGDRVLDIGCGTGADVIALSRHVGPGGHVTGVELSNAFVALARERATTLGLPLTLQQADIRVLPFADASFSRARIDRVLHFLPDAAGALREVARVTAPGGRIVITEPDWRTLTISGGDAELTIGILDAALDKTPTAHIAAVLPQRLAESGWHMLDHQDSLLELRDYTVAATLFGFQAHAARAVASTKISAKEGVAWLRSLQQASESKSFVCSLAGVVVTSTRETSTIPA